MKPFIKSLLFSLIFSNVAFGQTVFYEDFEKGDATVFDCTPYYLLNCPHANHYIVTTTLNAAAACLPQAFPTTIMDDVSPTGAGYFLFHGTARTGSTVGEVWGTTTPVRVQPNTNYIFSFYLANIYDSNVAQIEPSINGVRIAPQVSAVSLRQWERFNFCWNSGSATTADLSLRNNREEASGNDFTFDDIELQVSPPNQTTQNATICTGQVFIVGNSSYTQSGTYKDVLKSFLGCDSTVTTNLTVNTVVTKSQNISICNGQVFQINNNSYGQTGIYRDTLKRIGNCDSVVITNLMISPPTSKSQTASICSGQVFKVGNKTYSQSGIFRDTFKTITGCDSILITDLTVSNITRSSNSFTLCNGKSINFAGRTYTIAGTYRDTIRRINCDSISVVNINVLPPLSKTQNLTVCTGQRVQVGTKFYSQNGQYKDTLQSFNGCDSIILTNLIVKEIALELGQNQSINFHDSLRLMPTYSGQNLRWKWTPSTFLSCSSCNSPLVKPTSSVKYVVQLTDSVNNCSILDSIQFLVLGSGCSNAVYIPNVFSPNNDDVNDTFYPFAYPDCVSQISSMLIFDRWGELLFQKIDFPPNIKSEGWDGHFKGKNLAPDVYVYIIEVVFSDGKTKVFSGNVTLIR